MTDRRTSTGDPGAASLAEGDLLTVAQALKLLPVGKSTIHDLINEGALPCIRVGTVGSRRKRILLLRPGIEEYVRGLRAAEWRKGSHPGQLVGPDQVRGRVLAGARMAS